MNKKDRIILIALSNQLDIEFEESIKQIKFFLESLGFIVDLSNNIFKCNNTVSLQLNRANEFNNILKKNKHKYIFDVSGGDLSNELIPFINLEYIKSFNGTYVGYSDLTTIITLYTRVNKKSIYFNIKTLLQNEKQQNLIRNIFLNERLFHENYIENLNIKFIKGRSVKGKIVGGNIRCLLKLAGTKFMLSSDNKILFLESCSGNINRIRSYIAQYDMLGMFKNCNGILLGQFNEIDDAGDRDILINLFHNIVNIYDIALLETLEVGHSKDAKPLIINSHVELKKNLES